MSDKNRLEEIKQHIEFSETNTTRIKLLPEYRCTDRLTLQCAVRTLDLDCKFVVKLVCWDDGSVNVSSYSSASEPDYIKKFSGDEPTQAIKNHIDTLLFLGS
ncbi:MAG: hypothetical protein ACN2B6_00350 [Rickettsiales bacterium]